MFRLGFIVRIHSHICKNVSAIMELKCKLIGIDVSTSYKHVHGNNASVLSILTLSFQSRKVVILSCAPGFSYQSMDLKVI